MCDEVCTSNHFDLPVDLRVISGWAMRVAGEDGVEKAALQQLAGACGLLHRIVNSPEHSSSCAGIGPNSSSSSSSSSTSAALPDRHPKPLQRHAEASDMPALDESLLQLLPGGQVYTVPCIMLVE
jgi:hypothetical protein